MPSGVELLHQYVAVHNECVRTGDWEPLGAWFAEEAEFIFERAPVGPFAGREEIAAAYRERPPDDEVMIFSAEEQRDSVVAWYGWAREPDEPAGRMLLTARDGRIARLVVTFERSEPASST